MSPVALSFDRDALAALCARHGIRRLALFGSALRDELGPDSDLDLLVEFSPERRVGLAFITIQAELTAFFGRKVDLATPGFLSPHFRQRVLHAAVPLYEAA